MIKILPVALIMIAVSSALIYFRFFANNPQTTNPQTTNPQTTLIGSNTTSETEGPVEVPKTLPKATVEDRVKVLEEAVVDLVKKVNKLTGGQTDSSLNSRLNSIEASITDLKVQISSLGQQTTSSSNPTMYIPIGAGGSFDNTSWQTLSDYQIILDPGNFPGYKNMVLEVIFRMVDPSGTASVRLYNSSDNNVVSSEVSTTSTTFVLSSSSSFTLPSGSKTYVLQGKSSGGKTVYLQLARLRVNY